MKNRQSWQPSKYVFRKGKLIGSRNTNELAVSSRLTADLVAGLYHQYFPEYAEGDLLDLGCGKAPLYISYSRYAEKVICVDWGNSPHDNEYLDAVCDLTKPLPFKNSVFDTIIMSDVLEHIPVPQELCEEIHRILKKGGHILLNVPFIYGIHEIPFDYYRYTEFGLKRLLENSNLSIKKFTAVGGAPEVVADILAKHIKPVPLIGIPASVFIQSLAKLFLKTRWGEKVSLETSKYYPIGYFVVAEKR